MFFQPRRTSAREHGRVALASMNIKKKELSLATYMPRGLAFVAMAHDHQLLRLCA